VTIIINMQSKHFNLPILGFRLTHMDLCFLGRHSVEEIKSIEKKIT